MSIIYILLALSVCVASLFLVAFLWSLHTGQYDDDYSPPRRILFDETYTKNLKSKTSHEYEN
jgi:cbb3-type cytochrome oxidase maturation protein